VLLAVSKTKPDTKGAPQHSNTYDRLIAKYVGTPGKRRRARKIIDRGLTAVSSAVPPSSRATRRRVLQLLAQSGIPEDNRQTTLEQIETLVFDHAGSAERNNKFPRLSEHRAELEELINRAASLLQACNYLSQRSRLAIMDIGKDSPLYFRTGPDELQTTLQEFLVRADVAFRAIPEDAGGAPKHDDLRQLLLSVALIWYEFHPSDKGIVVVNAVIRGPLLNFARTLLSIFGVNAGSIEALGRLLYEMRDRAIAVAKSEQRRGVSTNVYGRIKVTSRTG
jgi:hypothetical protein